MFLLANNKHGATLDSALNKRKIMPKAKEIFDPKPGQHKLRDIWTGSLTKNLEFFRKTYSVTTAEELVSCITAGFAGPKTINEKEWNKLVALAERALPPKTLEAYKKLPKRRFPACGAMVDPNSFAVREASFKKFQEGTRKL